jgi:hypothetical protein
LFEKIGKPEKEKVVLNKWVVDTILTEDLYVRMTKSIAGDKKLNWRNMACGCDPNLYREEGEIVPGTVRLKGLGIPGAGGQDYAWMCYVRTCPTLKGRTTIVPKAAPPSKKRKRPKQPRKEIAFMTCLPPKT